MNKFVFVLVIGALLYAVLYVPDRGRDTAYGMDRLRDTDNYSLIEEQEPYIQFPEEKIPGGINMLSRILTGEAVVPDVESEVTIGIYVIIDSF
jgi:hypothetical protein